MSPGAGLSAAITGRRILSACILDRKIFPEPDGITGSGAAGHRVGRVGRRGKVLILFLDGSGSLLIHPKMTGQLVLTAAGATVLAGGHPSPSMLAPMPNPTTRAVFRLDQAGCLYYNDARRFGWIRLAGPDPCASDPFLRRLGPEPLDEAFTVAALRDSLTRHARAPVKAVLLNQAVVAGIGNIYGDESLHHARIHPARRAGSLSLPETRRLHAAIRAILHDAIETGGTSFAGYVNDFRGRPGYLDHAEVFRRQGQPCQACGTMIVRTRVASGQPDHPVVHLGRETDHDREPAVQHIQPSPPRRRLRRVMRVGPGRKLLGFCKGHPAGSEASGRVGPAPAGRFW